MADRVRARYVMDNEGFGALMVGPEIAAVALEAAQDIARDAAAGAQVDTGAYADAFDAKDAGVIVIAENPRAFAEAYNDDPAAPRQEFGPLKNRPRGRRTLRKAGQKYDTAKRAR